MIYNVEILNENQNYFEVLTYEIIDDVEYIRVGKINKVDVLSDIKIFRELEIKDKLNTGVIKLC